MHEEPGGCAPVLRMPVQKTQHTCKHCSGGVSARVENQATQKLFGYGESNPELPRSTTNLKLKWSNLLNRAFPVYAETTISNFLKLEIPARLKL